MVSISVAKTNLASGTKKHGIAADDQINLAIRWGITDATENQSATRAMIWNDPRKVFVSLFCRSSRPNRTCYSID